MSYAIARAARTAAGASLFTAAVLAVSLSFSGAGYAADPADSFRLAQAQQKAAPQKAQQPPADPTERQLGELQKRLAITPQQQAQFDAFAQVVKQNAQEMDALMQQEQQKPPQNAVESLKSSAQMSQMEADGLKRLQQPLEALYASLSDQQKRTADQLLSNAGGGQQPAQQQQPKKR